MKRHDKKDTNILFNPFLPFEPCNKPKASVKSSHTGALYLKSKDRPYDVESPYHLTENKSNSYNNNSRYKLDVSNITVDSDRRRTVQLLSLRIKAERDFKRDIPRVRDLSEKIGAKDDVRTVNALLGKSKQAYENFMSRKKKATMHVQDLWALPLTKSVIRAKGLEEEVEGKIRAARLAVQNRILSVPSLEQTKINGSWPKIYTYRNRLPSLQSLNEEENENIKPKFRDEVGHSSTEETLNPSLSHSAQTDSYYLGSNILINDQEDAKALQTDSVSLTRFISSSDYDSSKNIKLSRNQDTYWSKYDENLSIGTEGIIKTPGNRTLSARSAGIKPRNDRMIEDQGYIRNLRSSRIIKRGVENDYSSRSDTREDIRTKRDNSDVNDGDRSGRGQRERRKTKAFLNEANDQISKLIGDCRSQVSNTAEWDDVMDEWKKIFKNIDKEEEKKNKKLTLKKIEQKENTKSRVMIRPIKRW